MQANLENSAVATGLERSVFIPIPKKGNAKEYSNYCTIALISHTSKVMLKFSKPDFSNMWTVNSLMFKLVLGKAEEPEIKLPTSAGSLKSKRVPEKHLFLLYWLCQSLWLCGSQQTVENSEKDGNTRPPDLPLKKSECRSGSNSYNWTRKNILVPNRKRSMSRLYIVTLLI